MYVGYQRIFAAFILSTVAVLIVIAAWLATSWRDFDIPLSPKVSIRFAADGFRFNDDPGGWEWARTRVNFRGFIPDGWNASISVVRLRPDDDAYCPSCPEWLFEETLFSMRVRNLVCFLLVTPCVCLVFHFCRRERRGFAVIT